MGSAFVSIGKTILTNPLFLIVAIVGAIIAAVVGLLDELGILKIIFKAVGDAIGFVIQMFKDLLDWMGLLIMQLKKAQLNRQQPKKDSSKS
jgi:spore maturation protein SpmA